MAVIIWADTCAATAHSEQGFHAQEAEAKRQLKAAVQAQHASSTDAEKFTAAIASAAIELGLKSSSSQAGFMLIPVV